MILKSKLAYQLPPTMPELLTFKKFNDLALAENLAAILDENGIEYLLEESALLFNPTFASQTEASKEYLVKISPRDFEKATKALTAYESSFTDDVEPDYYLFDFSMEELMEIVTKRDEWSEFDYVLAKKLLAEKGLHIDKAAESKLNEARLVDLKNPEPSDSTWVIAGYIFAMAGGVLGFFIGWQLWNSKTTLPNGQQVYTYNLSDRKSGKQIFIFSIFGLAIALYYKFVYLS